MRISTTTLFETGSTRISEWQASMAKTQQQLSTGRRMQTAADDPVASAAALDVTQSRAVNAQYTANRGVARDTLSLTESTIASVSELVQDARALAVQAGNGTYADQQRFSIAAELRSQLDQMIGLANVRDGAGKYLFAGFQVDAAPFVKTAGVVQYNGDQGSRSLQVGSGRDMPVNENGQALFMSGGQDLFQTLGDLATLLETPVATPADKATLQAGVDTALTRLDRGLDNVVTLRATVGARMKELDGLDTFGEDLDVQYATSLSKLQDIDYAKAISDLSQQQTTLEAAQKSYVKITGLSLFNYLS